MNFLLKFRLYLLPCFILIHGCSKKPLTYTTETKQYIFAESKDNAADTTGLSFILPYHDSLQQAMDVVLAVSEQAMIKELPEGLLGNYCADACLRQAKLKCTEMNLPYPDFLILNHGGLRASLPKGNITIGNIYEIMPFENELVTFTLKGTDTESLIQYLAAKGGAPVSGLRFQIQDGKAVNIYIQNAGLEMKSNYTIATSDYLANGGDGFDILKKRDTSNQLSLKVRDALIADVRSFGLKNDTLKVEKDGRISRIH